MPFPEDVKNLINASEKVVERSTTLQKEAQQQTAYIQALLSTSKQLCQKAPAHPTRWPADPLADTTEPH